MFQIGPYEDEPLTQSIALATLETEAFLVNMTYASRYIRRRKPQYYDWRRKIDCVRGIYTVDDASSSFWLSIKPWRLIALQQATTMIVQVSRDNSIAALKTLTNDSQLANSIHSLILESEPVEFKKLYGILKRLHNMTHLRVTLSEYGKRISVEKVCQVLTQLGRIRSLHVDYSIDKSKLSSAPSLLFTQLRHGRILMPMPKTPNVTATAFAYKSLEVQLECPAPGEKWNQLVKLCPGLQHLCIQRRYADSSPPEPIIPPNLTTLTLISSLETSDMVQLKHLILMRTVVVWRVMVVLSPNVSELRLHVVTIEGCITGLPLRHLVLYHTQHEDDNATIRRMCNGILLNCKIDSCETQDLRGECEDWITHPEFLVDASVNFFIWNKFTVEKGWSLPKVKGSCNKKVILLLKKVLHLIYQWIDLSV